MPAPDLCQVALRQAREHGLHGRADSPPDWQYALTGATAGEPILVKDPADSRDDFYLISFYTAADATRTAWVMLDCITLKLREASLLDHWPVLAFPDTSDCQRAAKRELILTDGTVAKFRSEDFRCNRKNLVWKASAASILPYWPVKELIAAHPLTGEPVSIYVTQNGEVHAQLTPDEPAVKKQASDLPRKLIRNFLVAAFAGAAGFLLHRELPMTPSVVVEKMESGDLLEDRNHLQKELEETTATLNGVKSKASNQDARMADLLERIKEKDRRQKELEAVIHELKATINSRPPASPAAPPADPKPTSRPESPERSR